MFSTKFTVLRDVPVAVAIATLAALVVACGAPASSSGTLAATAASSVPASGSPAAPASTSSSPAVPATASTAYAGTAPASAPVELTGSAATALLTKAAANTQAAPSVTVAFRQPGKSFDLTFVKGTGCAGSFVMSATDTFKIVVTGGYVWILGSAAFWAGENLSQANIVQLFDKYVKIKSTVPIGHGMAQACNITDITGSIGNPGNATLAAVPTTYDGGPAYEVTPMGVSAAVFVSRGATPLLLKVDYQGNDGRVATFSGYDAGTITIPPAAQTLDGSHYGL